jgi:hypothetical protein
MATLKSQLESLAESFARQVLEALRAAPVSDLVAAGGATAGSPRRARVVTGGADRRVPDRIAVPVRKGKAGRLPRRSAEEIQGALGKIVQLVKRQKAGMRAEEIRAVSGLQAKELPRILKEGLRTRKLTAKGQKRATTYFAR